MSDLSNVDLALLFARLDRLLNALRASNDALFDSGGSPPAWDERRRLRETFDAIDDELRRRVWPTCDEAFDDR